MQKRRKKQQKKMEFSKKWLIACVAVSIFYTTMSYLLAWFDKNTVETLAVQIIDILWGTSGISFVGYVIQNSVRAYTASKFGIPNDNNNESRENTNIQG